MFLIFVCLGCGKGRNFEGSPFPFKSPSEIFEAESEFQPQSLFGFRPTLSGFEFNIFLISGLEGYAQTLNVSVNLSSQRASIGNVNSGLLNCSIIVGGQICTITWMNSVPYYGFDMSRYQFQFEFKKIVSVLKIEDTESTRFQDCILDFNQEFINGEKIKVSLLDLETFEKLEIIHYGFGRDNFGNFLNPHRQELKYSYAFDFESFFATEPHYFDSYETLRKGDLFLYRFGARSLDDMNTTLVHYCFYDNE